MRYINARAVMAPAAEPFPIWITMRDSPCLKNAYLPPERAREMLHGVELPARAAKVTLGPRGGNVIVKLHVHPDIARIGRRVPGKFFFHVLHR
ncbi:hypothetical protein AWV80_18545 [Cupriavidus sp. UYMU48A]|nr:hypothetical protein AWV80_18545 [Cupriavidus sp. UYMU48A]